MIWQHLFLPKRHPFGTGLAPAVAPALQPEHSWVEPGGDVFERGQHAEMNDPLPALVAQHDWHTYWLCASVESPQV